MSDNIPFDIQMDIMNRLPVKSLLQFRVVSKQWKFSIDNFEFIHENLAFRHMDYNLNIMSLTPVASSEVSTLSSKTWYNLDYDCFPRESIRIKRAGQAVIDGKIFWIGLERFNNDDGISNKIYLIVSFDLVTHQFHVQDMPEQVRVGEFSPPYYISQLGDSVIISRSFDFGNFRIFYAWALEVEGGFVSSCSMLFTIPHPGGHYLKLLGFSKDNQLIVEATIVQQWYRSLQVFHPTIQYFQNIDATHLKGQYKGTHLIAVGMDRNNQIVSIAFGICKGETSPCWSWWMSVLKECIGDNPDLLFISERHAVIALAVQNEFPLAYHAPDVYNKLCQVGPQRWSRAHCPLVRYNYLTSNSVESVNACIVVYRKLPVIKLAETNHAMEQDKISRRFTTLYYALPPNNTLSSLKQTKNDYDTNVMYDIAKVAGKIQLFVSHHQIDLSTVLIPNDGSLEEAFAAHYKLQIYIDHLGVDFIIAKYIFPNASLAEMMNHVITNYTSDSEDNKREVTQNDYTFNQMVEWAEQEHFEDEETKLSCPKIDLSTSMADSANDARKTIVSNLQKELEAEATLANTMLGNLTCYFENMRIREIQITMLQNMPTMSLNSYGLHALLMTHEADIRTTNNLIRARQELLRSIAEKQNFINNYRAI
ncbi:transposase, MuDR, MULE transposase domain protein [Tanacetum coccineum]